MGIGAEITCSPAKTGSQGSPSAPIVGEGGRRALRPSIRTASDALEFGDGLAIIETQKTGGNIRASQCGFPHYVSGSPLVAAPRRKCVSTKYAMESQLYASNVSLVHLWIWKKQSNVKRKFALSL